MKSFFLKSAAIVFVGLSGVALSAQAATIELNPGNTIGGAFGPANCEPECIIEVFGLDPGTELELLYKADVGSPNDPATIYSGTFADSYLTTFDNDPLDPTAALIEYIIGQAAIQCPSCYLAIKDGAATPGYYFYDLSSWNGTDSIEMTGFWFGTQGAISHVAIWGVHQVAEPATVGLLGLGLLGFGLARRRRS